MTTREAILLMRSQLRDIYDAREIESMARVIFEQVLLWQPVDMVMRDADELPDFFVNKLNEIISRLTQHEPLQYILGKARFHGHSFAVTPATLIPRPETEQLVDMIIDQNPGSDLRVLDIGTGSGCIAISLARALKFAQVTATDISDEALAVAQQNATALKTRVRLLRQDIRHCSAPSNEWDIIVSNPPYITMSEQAEMERNVLDYEPPTALFVPDDDPLRFYRAIAELGLRRLRPKGRLCFEINPLYAEALSRLLVSLGYEAVTIREDDYGKQRFATARKQE